MFQKGKGKWASMSSHPNVQDSVLTYMHDGNSVKLEVNTSDWHDWLENADIFTFRSSHGAFTARKERASNKRGSQYWRAYRKHNGKLRRVYLGKSQELTLQRLESAATVLANRE